jgi:enterochelin esterase-like enzyme
MKGIFWFFLLGLTLQVAATPQVNSGSVVQLKDFKSDYIGKRTIDIWLPEGYSDRGKQKYAVLYMMDGQMLFDAKNSWNGQEWRVDEVSSALLKQNKLIPFIVVAIHNAGEKRHSEYFPQQPFASLSAVEQKQLYQLERSPGQKLFATAVYSDSYLSFLVKELKPYILRHFSVYQSKEYNMLMGSSMGGLISLYALLQYPDQFGAAACLSTHWPGIFQQQDNPVPEQFLAYLQQKLSQGSQSRLYFDYGDQTLDAWYPPWQHKVDQLLQQQGWPEGQWQSRFFPGADHSEQAWANRLEHPLRFLLGK